VTTGLLSAVGYLKDNRLLPSGFKKETAEPDIASWAMPRRIRISRTRKHGAIFRQHRWGAGSVPRRAELWYQPIGFRWAHNLGPYKARSRSALSVLRIHVDRDSGAANASGGEERRNC